jgi:uncharacterized protein
MLEELKKDMITAMKSQDKQTLAVIRMVKAALDQEHIDHQKEINDDLLMDVVSKQIKMRKESIEEFKKGNRNDLVKQNEEEIKVLEKYLPQQLSPEEIKVELDKIFAKVQPTGKADMGKIMKEVSASLKGKVDMKAISTLINERLK